MLSYLNKIELNIKKKRRKEGKKERRKGGGEGGREETEIKNIRKEPDFKS